MSTPEDVRHEIHQLKVKITEVEAKIKHLEQLDPANQRLPALEEQLAQLLKNKNLLLEHLAQLRKGGDVSGASQPEPALNLLHWGYKSASIDSSSSTSHKRRYKGDCELVRLDLGPFCNIAKAKLHAVTTGVTVPAGEAMRIRRDAADLEAEATGKPSALTTEAELNVRFCDVVGKGVTDVVNACIQQKHPTWGNLSFKLESRPSEGSGRPDFFIKQTGAADEVDVCGGEGKLPNVMAKQYINLAKMRSAEVNALMQACSYCQEKVHVLRVAGGGGPIRCHGRLLARRGSVWSLYPRAPRLLQGVPVAVKATDACKALDIVELLWHEAQVYEVLRDLQGHLLPVMHGCGYWGGRNTFFLATAVVPGLPISRCTDVATDEDLAQAARQALHAIHQRGVAHGDVRADNILVQHCGNTPKVIFIDFGQAYLHPTPEECQRELADLEAELHEL